MILKTNFARRTSKDFIEIKTKTQKKFMKCERQEEWAKKR